MGTCGLVHVLGAYAVKNQPFDRKIVTLLIPYSNPKVTLAVYNCNSYPDHVPLAGPWGHHSKVWRVHKVADGAMYILRMAHLLLSQKTWFLPETRFFDYSLAVSSKSAKCGGNPLALTAAAAAATS